MTLLDLVTFAQIAPTLCTLMLLQALGCGGNGLGIGRAQDRVCGLQRML